MRWICLVLCCSLFILSVGCARMTDTEITDEIVLIDPGHGGFDGGAVADDGTLEKHINLVIALYLRDMLYICGVPVTMTRSTDNGLEADSSASIRDRKVSDMRHRLSMYDGAALVLSIHQNQFSQSQYSGAQVFYSANHSDSLLLAQSIRTSIVNGVQPDNTRETKKATDGIYLLYHTRVPAVLIECGFLSNPEERDTLKSPVYQQRFAFAVAAGYWYFQSQK